MKTRTLKRWKFLVWEALSKLKRADGICMRCGKEKRLEAHHLVPKSAGNYARFCKDNIVCLCNYCHMRWWHGRAIWDEQRDLVYKWIGKERYDEIKFNSQKSVKYTEEDYEKMLKEYTDLYKQKIKEI